MGLTNQIKLKFKNQYGISLREYGQQLDKKYQKRYRKIFNQLCVDMWKKLKKW